MERAERFISVDDHVQETPDVWAARLSQQRWCDRIPHVEEGEGGAQRWVIDGERLSLGSVAVAAALMEGRVQEPQRWEEVPLAVYRATERLKALDADGVDYSVLYPTIAGVGGSTFARLTDPEFEQACVRAYNDWLIEEWAAASHRFIPQCIVPIYPVEATVAEIVRAVRMGHRGVVYPALPILLRDVPHVNNAEYDPIWATCEELGVPLCLHAGSTPGERGVLTAGMAGGRAKALAALARPASCSVYIATVLLSQMLPRHPRLKVIFAESALGWGAELLEWADHQFHQDRLDLEGYERGPSQVFKPQCYFTGWYEPVAVHAPYLGIDNILWSTNFPQATSTWPESQRFLKECFDGVMDEDREKILWHNPARIYGVEDA